jgi:hypothetical protein
MYRVVDLVLKTKSGMLLLWLVLAKQTIPQFNVLKEQFIISELKNVNLHNLQVQINLPTIMRLPLPQLPHLEQEHQPFVLLILLSGIKNSSSALNALSKHLAITI